jgi:hypothetical protein
MSNSARYQLCALALLGACFDPVGLTVVPEEPLRRGVRSISRRAKIRRRSDDGNPERIETSDLEETPPSIRIDIPQWIEARAMIYGAIVRPVR